MIVQPDLKLRRALIAAVRSDPSLELVGVAGDVASAVKVAAEWGAEVALIDARLPDGGSIEAVARLYGLPSQTRCILLSDGADVVALAALFAVGAVGYLPEGAMATRVTDAIRQAVDGQLRLGRDLSRTLFARLLESVDGEGAGERAARREREAVIRRIIDERQFEMVFQPIVALADGAPIGVEALARFTAAEPRSPDVWLGEAGALGLRPELELALLAAAVAQCPCLEPGAFMTVNLSPDAAASGLVADAIPPDLLTQVVIELTDHRQVGDYEVVAEALADLRAGGLRVAVDDSGHGLSSLHQLTRLEPDLIKLNRTLTRNVDSDSTRRALVFALSTVAVEIGAAVIAEGIETVAELEALRELGIPYGQGYFIAKPEPLAPGGRIAVGPIVEPAPSLVPRLAAPTVPAAKLRTVPQACRAVFGLLEKELPGAGFVVSQFDRGARRWRVVAASAALRGRVEPGWNAPLEESLCHHMATGRGPRICNDVALEPLYAGLEAGHRLNAASYIGVPLESEAGEQIGALAAVSPDADRFADRDLGTLAAMAALVLRGLDAELDGLPREVTAGRRLRDIACSDELTGTLNRPSLGQSVHELGERLSPSTTYVLDARLDDAEVFTARSGQAVADLAVKTVAATMLAIAQPLDLVGRAASEAVTMVLRERESPDKAESFRAAFESRMRVSLARRDIDAVIEVRLRAWDAGVAAEFAGDPAPALAAA
jgi:EAL domain-containing protein (putative c-di-GMP-specific phosphodiesterase class I)/DNA-binding NarL/FixJ family response regulator/GGDEF domain-containing protein